jgi:ERCC4-type nuclease
MITVIQDTREKKPWNFEFYGLKQKVKNLKTGDYTIEGYENEIFIERKRSSGELAQNFGSKSKPFYAELERAKSFKHKYLICEFPEERIGEFPRNSGIPSKAMWKIRMSANYLSACIFHIKGKYGIEVIFTNSPAEAECAVINVISSIFEQHS